MKISDYCSRILIIEIIVWLLPCFTLAGRKESACSINSLGEWLCAKASNNYMEPYCVTNYYHANRESSDVNYAEKCIFPLLTNKLSISNWETMDKGSAVRLFCDALLWKSDTWRVYFAKPSSEIDSWDWQQTFDSHQSLFLHALCWSFSENGKYPFLKDNLLLDVYKWDITEALKLKQMSDWKDVCSLVNGIWIPNCDIAIYATKIYEGIMSDILKIKYAQVLNVNTVENFDLEKEKKTLDFMSWYYLLKDGKEENNGKNLKDQYPKTFWVLQDDQKYYKNVLGTLKVLNNSKLAQMSQNSGCPVKWNMTWINFVACALHDSQWNWFALTPSFVTLFYNEILHYRLFVAFYEKRLVQNYKTHWSNYTEKEMRVLQSEISDFEQYLNLEIEATKLAQHNFEEFNMTYPWHIWMLLYTEKIENFRNNYLSKIITPFYSLSEKLQNVQIPKN